MRKFYLLSTLVLLAILYSSKTVQSQDFSNKGKEFWLCFPHHVPSGANATLSVWITSDKASSGVVTISDGTFAPKPFNIAANGLQEIVITHAEAHLSSTQSFAVIPRSLKIKVDAGRPAVVAYAQQWGNARSAATLLLPTNVLGKRYYVTSFTQAGTPPSGTNLAKSQFQIIATQPNTVVKITPRENGVLIPTVSITLPLAGDLYQYQSDFDLTGTLIESVSSASGGCLPIAVFSGSSNLTIHTSSCGTANASYDPLFQQQYPISSWGKNFVFIPFADYPAGNPYRVLAAEDNTTITIDGSPAAIINAGEIYPNGFTSFPSTTVLPTSIKGDKPIAVIHYAQRLNCGGGGFGDPDMVLLNPIEQSIKDITIFSSSQQAIQRQWVNILLKTVATPSFRISFNGGPLNPPAGAFQAVVPAPGYSYLRELLPGPGSYRLLADSGFNAIAYGFSNNFESYAYSAGTNVKDFYQQIGVSTQYGVEISPTVCVGTQFKFKVSLPYCADSIDWDLSQLPAPTPPNPPRQYYANCAAADSTTTVNGVPIYWYSIPLTYTLGTVGTYPVTITTWAPNIDGCGNVQEIDFELEVIDPPAPNFSYVVGGCAAEPVQFTETTVQIPKPTYSFYWNFGDPASGAANISNARNPTHLFSGPGTYTVKYSAITTPGCFTDTSTQTVTVPANPNATISATATNVCVGGTASVTFVGVDGTPPYTYYYTVNPGGPASINGGGAVSIPVNTATPGTFTYTLDSIRNQGSAICVRTITGQSVTVNVHPLPTATISGTVTACQNGTSPVITFTGAAGTAPYTFTYTINGGPNQTVVSAGTTATVSVPTAATGTFVYTLVSVQDASASLCSQSQTGSATVTINPQPTASISGTISVCRNAASPNITFTGANGTAPYTFAYNINGGPTQTVVSAGPTATVAASTAVVGTFVYNLVSVQDVNGSLCNNPQTGSATVTVNPLPTASISGTISVCQNATAPTITFTGASTTAPYTFTYNINGGPNQTVVSVGPTATVTAPTGTPGTFIYNLVSVQDASASTCSQAQAGTATVTVNPSPTATISGTITVCRNASSPNITFTGTTGTAPFTFTYTINGGPNQTVVSAGPTATVAVPTGTVGTFTYALVSVQDASPSTCSQSQTGSAVVTVNALPTATISGTITVCRNATAPSITFTGSGTTSPYTFTYTINGGPNQTVVSAGPTATVSVPTGTVGTFVYALVSVQDASAATCSQAQSGNATVTVAPLPTATVSGTTAVCQNAASPNITFTGAGTTAPYTFTYNINGGPNQTVVSAGPSATVSVPTGTAGTFTYNLVGVQDASATACSQAQTGSATVTVNPLPTASISGNATVCRNATPPNVTFTGAAGTAPYTFTYNINGGPNQTVVSAGPTATVAASTAVAGTFVYNLVSVQDASASACSQAQSGSVTIIVNAPPTANISGTISVCQNGTAPTITFTGAGSVTPYTFTYNINGGPNQTVVSAGPSATVTAPTGTPGTFVYNLVSVADGSAAACSQAQTGSATVTVNPSPTATINGTITVCRNAAPPNITFNGTAGTAPFTFTYTINGGPNQTVVSVGPSATVPVPTGTVGTYVYTLVSVQDASANLCSQSQSGTATVTVNALPTATITGTTTVCKDSPPPTITFTGAAGTAPYTFTYTINGGPNQTVVSAGPTATVTVPTGTVGTFTYALVSVAEGSATACSQAQSGTATVNVNPAPTANISGATTVCQNDPAPTVTFTGGGTTAPYTFTYTINGGPNQTVTSVGNTATVSAPTGTPGTYTYALVSVQDGSPTTCSQAQSGTVVITVDADHIMTLTSATSTTSQTVCSGKLIVPVTYTLGGGATGVNITGLPAGLTSSVLGGVVSITGAPTSIGLQNYTIQTTGTNCNDVLVSNSIDVLQTPAIQFNAVPGICEDVPAFQVNAAPAGGTFSGTGITSGGLFTPSVADAGDHVIRYTYTAANGCENYSEQTISVYPLPIVDAGPDRGIIEGGQITLTPVITANFPVTYLWTPSLYLSNPNIANPIVSGIPDDRVYRLLVTSDKGCSATDVVFVKLLRKVEIPNIFSPNGDGIHDTWMIKYLDSYPGCTVEIFNRYGQRIFQSEGYSKPWDGTINGKPVPVGTYYYIINPKNGRSQMSGYVDVIR